MQDQGLDVIAEGLDTLKNMAHDMNEVCYNFLYFPMFFSVFKGLNSLHYEICAGIGSASSFDG